MQLASIEEHLPGEGRTALYPVFSSTRRTAES